MGADAGDGVDMTFLLLPDNANPSYFTHGKPYRLINESGYDNGMLFGGVVADRDTELTYVNARHPDGCPHLGNKHWIVEKVPALPLRQREEAA